MPRVFFLKLNYSFLDCIIFAGILFVATYIFQERMDSRQKAAEEYHCSEINKDVSRPYLRECIKTVSLEKYAFSFKTKNGEVETYSIIPHRGTAMDIKNNTFDYNFIK